METSSGRSGIERRVGTAHRKLMVGNAHPTQMAKHTYFVANCLLVVLAGCADNRPKPPAVYPVSGHVKFTDGKPFSGGIITFTSKSDPRLVMEAAIVDDGSFALSMMFNDQRLSGAAEGPYQVMVSSRFQASRGVSTYILANDVVIAPKENVLTIEVDPAAARK